MVESSRRDIQLTNMQTRQSVSDCPWSMSWFLSVLKRKTRGVGGGRTGTRGKSFKKWNSHLIHGLVSAWKQGDGQGDLSGLHPASLLSWGVYSPQRKLLHRCRCSPYSLGFQKPLLNFLKYRLRLEIQDLRGFTKSLVLSASLEKF